MFMALSEYVPIWLSVLAYAIALGAAVLGLVATDTVRDHIQNQDVKLNNSISTIRAAQAKVNQMVAQCSNTDSASIIRAFAEELKYSDPVSSLALVEIEADLCAIIDELQQAIVEGDNTSINQLCRKATAILSERNRICKLKKK